MVTSFCISSYNKRQGTGDRVTLSLCLRPFIQEREEFGLYSASWISPSPCIRCPTCLPTIMPGSGPDLSILLDILGSFYLAGEGFYCSKRQSGLHKMSSLLSTLVTNLHSRCLETMSLIFLKCCIF